MSTKPGYHNYVTSSYLDGNYYFKCLYLDLCPEKLRYPEAEPTARETYIYARYTYMDDKAYLVDKLHTKRRGLINKGNT